MFIFVSLEIGFAGCETEDVIEIEDDMPKSDIDQMVHEMAMENATSWEWDERFYDDWDEDTLEAFYENVYGTWRPATEDEIAEYS